MMLTTLVAAWIAAAPLAPEAPTGAGTAEANAPAEERTLQPLAADRALAYRAKTVMIGDGKQIENGTVLVQDGVIHSVGADLAVPEGVRVIELDGVLTPGLVASHGYEGLGAERTDMTRPALPEADIAIGYKPSHEDFEKSLAAGVTSIVLAPAPNVLIPGTTAVVKSSGDVVVRRPAQLEIVLSDAALNWNEFPTSHAGAMAELDRLFADPQGQVARAAAGNLPVLLVVGGRGDIPRALSFAERYRLRGALYGATGAEDLIDPIAKSGLGVVCDPFDVGVKEREMRAVVALAEKGVRLGFGLDAPDYDPTNLRFGAALCVRAGLDRGAAMKALCADAAAIAGVERRVGKLERGLDADMVLWTGDPIELSSSVVAVYVDGTLVHGGEE